MTDDLISIGCGYYVGRFLFWTSLVLVVVVFTHPWVLLIPLAIWLLAKWYGSEENSEAGGGSVGHIGATATSAGHDQCQQVSATGWSDHYGSGTGATGRQLHSPSGGNLLICLTWNLGRRAHLGHADLIRNAKPDIVALQEIGARGHQSLVRELTEMGLGYQHGGPDAARTFPFAALIASRWPIRGGDAEDLKVPFPERVQVAIVATPFGDVEVLNVHVPAATSSGVAVKVATFEGIERYLACPALIPRIVCGDFNTPKSEIAGRVEYWGSAHQQRAECAVIEGGATTGLRDAFRHVNGPSANAASWRASNGVARRYDHVFASPELLPIEAKYGDLEQITSAKMSDHAPLRVVFMATRAASVATAPSREKASVNPDLEVRLTPVPVAISATAREETAMPTTDDTELRAFLQSLEYRIDERIPPDDRRRIEFRKGWNRATNHQHMKDATLKRKLTWNNLGYRAGVAYGPVTVAKIHETFDRFAAIYVRDRA